MSTPTSQLHVRVPGSTSNVGPGFDLLGIAVSMFVDVRMSFVSEAGEHELVRSAALEAELSGSTGDLTLAAFDLGRARFEIPGQYRFEIESEIPIGRGIGSSGAAIAAGLLLAQALSPRAVEMEELLSLGVEFEGHPENVAASLLGGCVLCHPGSEDEPAGYLSQPLNAALGFALVWPDTPLSTKAARAVLPAEIPLSTAVETTRRLAFLLDGLRTGNPAHLTRGGHDLLHVPHRLVLLEGGEEILAAGRSAGAWIATISGSGSALLAIGPRLRMAEIGSAMERATREHAGSATAKIVEPVLDSPVVRTI